MSNAALIAELERAAKRKRPSKKKAKKTAKKKTTTARKRKPSLAAQRLAMQIAIFGRPLRKKKATKKTAKKTRKKAAKKSKKKTAKSPKPGSPAWVKKMAAARARAARR